MVSDEATGATRARKSGAAPVRWERPALQPSELVDRLALAEGMLLAGERQRSVASRLVAEYGVTRRSAQRYIRAVHALWRAQSRHADGDPVTRRERLRQQMLDLYARCLEAGDHATAERLTGRMISFEGLDQPERVEVVGMYPRDAVPEALRAEITQRLRALREDTHEQADTRALPATASEARGRGAGGDG